MIDGIRLASKQDIPALCAVWKASFPDDDDGRLLQIWKGTPMPQIEQVAFWAKDV